MYSLEEHIVGDTAWVSIRAHSSERSWLTMQEAAELGKALVERYIGTEEVADHAS
jgi:hypothetical protein